MSIKKIKGRNVSEEKDVAPAPEKKVPALEEPTTVLEGVNTVVITTAAWSLCRPPGPELQTEPGRSEQWNCPKRLSMSGSVWSMGEVSLWT